MKIMYEACNAPHDLLKDIYSFSECLNSQPNFLFILLFSLFNHPANQAQLPDLSSQQLNKLRHLTVVSLATHTKVSTINMSILDVSGSHNLRKKTVPMECPFKLFKLSFSSYTSSSFLTNLYYLNLDILIKMLTCLVTEPCFM